MRRRRRPFLVAVLLALACCFQQTDSLAQFMGFGRKQVDLPQPSPAAMDPLGIRASDLLGEQVRSLAGVPLGSISDLVIDSHSDRVVYVIVCTGGFVGIGTQRRVVPPGALSLATVERRVVALDITPERWRNAPLFRKNLLQTSAPSDLQLIYRYYGQPLPGAPAQAQILSHTPSPTGHESADAELQHGRIGRFQLATSTIGQRVINRQGQQIAKISDLLVDLGNTRATLALLAPGSAITAAYKEASDQLFAVPMNDFRTNTENTHSVLEATPADFQRANALAATNWPTVGPPTGSLRIYRYQFDDSNGLVPPDNTGRNVRDRHFGTVTPMDQSEDRRDLQLTCRIRRAIMKHSGLSAIARNIKIITINGRVFLRGPVRSLWEMEEIIQLADRAAGSGNVKSELEAVP